MTAKPLGKNCSPIIHNSYFMTLYIDTTDFSKVTYALAPFSLPPMQRGGRVREGVFKRTYKIDPHKSHETLGHLANFLLHHKIKLEEGTLLPGYRNNWT